MKSAIYKTYIAVLFGIACLICGVAIALHVDHPHAQLLNLFAAWTENVYLAFGAMAMAITVVMWLLSVFGAANKVSSPRPAYVSTAQLNDGQPNDKYSQNDRLRFNQPVSLHPNRERQRKNYVSAESGQKPKKAKTNRPIRTPADLETRLAQIVGLEGVKETLRSIYATAKVEQQRRAQGVGSGEPMTLHMAFTGNPGTGKTTVARLVGEMFRDMGILSTGEFVEASEADLVSQYVGDTPQKVKALVRKAMGGVLFIDEAYSLLPAQGGNGPSHKKEAIDNLIAEMENNRGDLVVIFAGYAGPMHKLLHYNEGMPSRVPFVLKFDDYSVDEFMQIVALETAKKKLTMTQEAVDYVRGRMRTVNIGQNGNGRFARNLIEATIRRQATRLVNMNRPSKQDLVELTIDDFRTSQN